MYFGLNCTVDTTSYYNMHRNAYYERTWIYSNILKIWSTEHFLFEMLAMISQPPGFHPQREV